MFFGLINTTALGAETTKPSHDYTEWTSGSGKWTEAAHWSGGAPKPFQRAKVRGNRTVVVPASTYVAGNLEVGLSTGDRARVELRGSQLILRQDSLRVGEYTGGEQWLSALFPLVIRYTTQPKCLSMLCLSLGNGRMTAD